MIKLQRLHDIFKMRHGKDAASRHDRIVGILFYSVISFFFFLIIVSFIFFYGWSKTSRQSMEDQSFAKVRAGGWNPLHRWDYIDARALNAAQQEVIQGKLRLLGGYIAQMLQQQGGLEQLASTPEKARQAADDVLLDRAAQRMGVYVDLDAIKQDLIRQPGMTNEVLERAAARYKMTPLQLIEAQRKTRELNTVRALKSLTASASLFELWQEYSLIHEKITLDLAAYPTKDMEKQVVVTDQDLQKYLADHKDRFHVPELRRYAYVKVSRDALRKNIQPTDAQIQSYFEQNQADYLRAAATKVEDVTAPPAKDRASTATLTFLANVRPQAQKLADWTTLTQTMNQMHPDMNFLRVENWIEAKDTGHSEAYLRRLQTLRDDQASTPIMDSQGIHMVRITQRRKAGVPPLAEIRTKVQEDYANKKTDEAMKSTIKLFNDELKRLQSAGGVPTLSAFAQAVKFKDELTTRVASTATDIPGLGSFPDDRDYFQTLELNKLSDVIEKPDLAAVVVTVEQTEPYDPKLSEVRGKVEEALRKNRAGELARVEAENSLKLLQQGADFQAALAKAPRPPLETNTFTREEPIKALDAPLINFRQQTLKINAGSIGVSPYGNDPKNPLGYAVWRVKKFEKPDPEQFRKDRRQFEQEYLQLQRDTIAEEWMADQRRKADFQLLAKETQE